MTRRWIQLLAVASTSAVLFGCGETEDVRTLGETEGLYVNAGGLTYQVQVSRQLNPDLAEDRAYVSDLPAGTTPPGGDETWFGVFMRVQNEEDEAHLTAEEFFIEDSEGREYRPVEIDPEENPLAYRPQTLEPGELLPDPESIAAEGPTQGQLILFKLPVDTLARRPLELHINSPIAPQQTAIVDLDV